MSATITPARLELCRLVREHCYRVLVPVPLSMQGTDEVAVLARVALNVPIETMAGWFMLDETVMANIRLAMTMVMQDLDRDDQAQIPGLVD